MRLNVNEESYLLLAEDLDYADSCQVCSGDAYGKLQQAERGNGLDKLILDKDEDVRAAAMEYLDEVAEYLCTSGEDHKTVYENTALSAAVIGGDKILDKLVNYRIDEVRIHVAEHGRPQDLKKLASDKSRCVRETVAKNGNCSEEILEKLTTDDEMSVVRAVAKNPNCPKVLLKQLSKDDDPLIRMCVAEHKNCPKGRFEKLAQDKNEWVRTAVAANPNCPKKVLTVLAQDQDENIRDRALQNLSYRKKVTPEKMAAAVEAKAAEAAEKNTKSEGQERSSREER